MIHLNCLLVAAVVLASPVAGQPFLPDSAASRTPLLRVDSNLVLVPVSVTDSQGRLVQNLRRSDFVLSEDRTSQTLVSFVRESEPISVGIVLDLSGSMVDKIERARIGIKEFLNNLEPDDEAFLVTFADKPELKSGFSSDPSLFRAEILAATPRGSTALYDAVHMAVREMRYAQNDRKIVLVISDGGDNHSRTSESELRRALEETDVQIHAIGIHEHPTRPEEARGPWVLEDLTAMTGGQYHVIHNAGELPALAENMGVYLHDCYLLGYRPSPPGPSGAYRHIEVKVHQDKGSPKLQVHARHGYRMQ